ncbi:MAG TPA: hypothetical protein VJ867_05220 [Gemmatimonadaceae bacterium]|nr:hypothetical protein [Gemmatimonadaceae bacterium]
MTTEASIELAGRPVVLSYTGLASEYDALHRRAIVVDRSHRHRMRFAGDKAADALNGLLTNDVTALHAGSGAYAAALTPKGKVAADVRVLRLETDILVDAPARARDGWVSIVRKYVNPRLAKYTDASDTMRSIGVFGAQARYVVEEMTGVGHSALALMLPYAHVMVQRSGGDAIVMRSPELGVEGFELFVASDAADEWWELAVRAHATPAGLSAWEVARVEAGRPEWGVDMDDSTLAQEANLEELGAVSYTKGCYTGQEVVARVHFRGHVNRSLRGLRGSGTTTPPTKATLFDLEGKIVGDVRSAVTSPRLGAIALGMVRREIENGTPLWARWSAETSPTAVAGEMQLDVAALPFAS